MAKKVETPKKKAAAPAKKSGARASVATAKKTAHTTTAKKAPAKQVVKVPAKKSAASVKKAPAKAAAKTTVKKSPPKQAAKPAAKTRTVKQLAKPSPKTDKTPTAGKAAAKAATSVTKAPTRAAPAKSAAAKTPAAHLAPVKQSPVLDKVAPAKSAAAKSLAKKAASPAPEPPVMVVSIRGETKEGIKYTKDFDAKFLAAQMKLLMEARESLTGQAVRLEDEANSLIDDEMGDVQFDDESGEGDTMVVERERDLFLSARARQDIEEIDAAINRLKSGTYGYSVISMRPIPRERLEAIPWATELTEEKVGGIGRR